MSVAKEYFDQISAPYYDFLARAKPLLDIQDPLHYEQALALVEYILDCKDDSADDPLNPLLDLLAHAIERYENLDPELVAFDQAAEGKDPGITMLQVIMDQHGLGVDDFHEEIGSKSLVSLILSGDRDLTKKHIRALSRRFDIEPGLFI